MTNAISMSGPQVPTPNTETPDLMNTSEAPVREGMLLGGGFVGLSIDQAGLYSGPTLALGVNTWSTDARPFKSILVGPSLYLDILSRNTPALYQVEGDGTIVVPCDPKNQPNADGVYLVENGREENAVNGGVRMQVQSLVPLSENAHLALGFQGQSSVFVTDDGKISYPTNMGPTATLHVGDLGKDRDWFLEVNGSASRGITFRRNENGGNGPATEARLQLSIGREVDASEPAPTEADVATLPEQPLYAWPEIPLLPEQPVYTWPAIEPLPEQPVFSWGLSPSIPEQPVFTWPEEKTVEELQVNLETVVKREPPNALSPIAFRYNEPSEDSLRAIQALKPGESNEAIMRQIFRTYAPANEMILSLVDVVCTDLHNNPGLGLTLEGYTSLEGDENYNQALSLRRAEALAWLILQASDGAIAPEKITAIGYGEGGPNREAEDNTEAARNKNRRVDFTYVTTGE